MKPNKTLVVYCFTHNESFETVEEENEHMKWFQCILHKIPKKHVDFLLAKQPDLIGQAF